MLLPPQHILELVPESDKVRRMFRGSCEVGGATGRKSGVPWEQGGPSLPSREKGSQEKDWDRKRP